MKHKLLYTTILLSFAIVACNNDEILEIPISEGAILDIEVGGPTQPNQVYVDFSTDMQTAVHKSIWDIAFYSGSEFVVILNSATEVMAQNLQKSDWAQVEESDYEGFKEQMNVDAIFSNLFSPPPYPDWFAESSNWIDSPDGDLNNTAIEKISTTEDVNNIYFINRGQTPERIPRGEYLVRVVRSGNGYKIEFKIPGSAEMQTTEIAKDENFNLVYFNFDNGIVTSEPKKDLWDIAFTTYMEKLDVGGGIFIPYRFQDYVIQNRTNAKVAVREIEESESVFDAYERFTLDDTNSLVFNNDLNNIGSTWRSVASPTPGSVTGVKDDRFYIVEDSSGNFYKLLFTQMLNNEGERGFPQITYELLK